MYTCQTCHHSGDSPIYTLRAQTERGAKLEARRLFGNEFSGHMIILSRSEKYSHSNVARAIVGRPGWVA